MINLLKRTFEDFEYVQIENNCSGDLYLYNHKYKKDFWAILKVKNKISYDEVLNVKNTCQKYFGNDKSSQKNTSLLILLSINNITVESLNEVIEWEEDPYDFKKYVIIYTPSDELDLRELNISNIQSYLMNPEVFRKLKEEDPVNSVGCYHLLYSIAHKLPFVMMNVEPQESNNLLGCYQPSPKTEMIYKWSQMAELSNLEEEIKKEFEEYVRF